MIPSINKQRKKNVKERLNHFLENPSEEIEKIAQESINKKPSKPMFTGFLMA